MATQLQLALRRDEAYGRITKAANKLAKANGAKSGAPLDARHRDPQIEGIMRLEQVADILDELVKGQGKADKEQPPITVETVVEQPSETVETVEVLHVDLDTIEKRMDVEGIDRLDLPDGSTIERDAPKGRARK